MRWLAAILLLGAALRLVPVWFGLPLLAARPDEEVAVSIATRMQDGDLNPRFFHWPSLTFYLFAGAYGAASLVRRGLSLEGPLSIVDRVLLARALVALAGTCTLAVLFAIGRRVGDVTTGLLAALLLAVALLHVRDSHFAMADVLMTCLLTASLALLLRALDRPSPAGFAAAGLAAGLAASTKYNALAVAGAMGAVQLLRLAEGGRILAPRTWMPSIAYGGALLLGFFAATPYALLDYSSFEADLRFDFTHLSTGHGLDLGRGWSYHLRRSLPYGAGVPTFVAAVAGLWPLVRHYSRPAIVLAGFVVPFYAAIGSGTTVFFRYIMPLLPVVCLLAALAVRHAGLWLAARTRLSTAAATALLALIVSVPSFVNAVWFDVLLARTDSRVLAAGWLVPRLTADATLYDSGGDYSKLDLRHVRFHEWRFNADEHSFGHPDGHTPDWIVLSESPLRLYASIPPQLRQLVQEKYDLVLAIPATRGRSRAAVYDLQDAFFLPFTRFDTVVRPGPTIRIYRRRDAPPLPDRPAVQPPPPAPASAAPFR